MKLSSSDIEKCLSQKKLYYISRNGNAEKNVLYFLKRSFLIFQEMEIRKASYISESNFVSSKSKKKQLL